MARRSSFNNIMARAQQEQLENFFFGLVESGDATGVADFLRDHTGAREWRHADEKDILHIGETALHIAARLGRLNVAQELVNAGAEVDALDDVARTPLMVAATWGKTKVIDYLLQQHADPNEAESEGLTPLCFAARNGPVEAARMLIDGGAAVDGPGERADPPLFYALHMDNEDDARDMIRLLLECGADAELRNSDGYTAKDFAAEEGKKGLSAFIGGCAEEIRDAKVQETRAAAQRDLDIIKNGSSAAIRIKKPLIFKPK